MHRYGLFERANHWMVASSFVLLALSGLNITFGATTLRPLIGAEGFARVDFLMAGERIVVSEINTIPGFTPISLFPTMPAEAGYSFTDVCLRVVALALERHAGRPATHLTPTDLPR